MFDGCTAGWENKLWGVCSDDEGWYGLEKSFKAIFSREVQKSESEIDEGWIIGNEQWAQMTKHHWQSSTNENWLLISVLLFLLLDLKEKSFFIPLIRVY